MGSDELKLTAVEARKQRKKAQNRVNQRAHRQRISEREAPNQKSARRPYQLVRWRVEECTVFQHGGGKPVSAKSSEDPISAPPYSVIDVIEPSSRLVEIGHVSNASFVPGPPIAAQETLLPLPSDHHLLHLIHYNVVRALVHNKNMLRILAKIIILDPYCANPDPNSRQLCDGGQTIIQPVYPDIPNLLFPTYSQMSLAHPSWIDVFPYSQLRDNLIRREGLYDPYKLFGDITNDTLTLPTRPNPAPVIVDFPEIQEEDDDIITASVKGFIVWGEPHIKESWEVTPGFLKRWSWVLEDCEELIDISNTRRKLRGQRPMQMLATSGWGIVDVTQV